MVYKLDKAENALRQRCRLRRVERGTRHPEASISQKLAEVGRQAADAFNFGRGLELRVAGAGRVRLRRPRWA